jgi:Rad3-related DNA helicase
MKSITNCKPLSIILTSGTLQPFDPLMDELGIKFEVTLANKHVIKKDQIHPGIITEGINSLALNFKFENRENVAMLRETAWTLFDLTMRIRGGILVFFPSYTFMKSFHDLMVDDRISIKIKREANKDIIIESEA